jgi:hypothetical protein
MPREGKVTYRNLQAREPCSAKTAQTKQNQQPYSQQQQSSNQQKQKTS